MDFAKFCDLLEKRSLFFSKPENFKDPWEGFFTKKHFEEQSYENFPPQARKAMVEMAKNSHPELTRKTLAVNCWHINDSESEAFWRNYSERGVAIQSTFGRLRDSFKENLDYTIYIGEIEYKNHEVDTIDVGNLFNSILWKRKSFEYERELRAVIWEKEFSGPGSPRLFDTPKGQNMKVDLGILIENIYTTPFETGDWFKGLVDDTVKRYGLSVPCIKSSLMDGPPR